MNISVMAVSSPSYLQGSADKEKSRWRCERVAERSRWVLSFGRVLEKWIDWRIRSAITGKAEELRYSLKDSERKAEREGVC